MNGRKKNVRRKLLITMLCYDFGTLFFFKYMPFVTEELNKIIGYLQENHNVSVGLLPDFQHNLPLGISFYTFQIAAYAIDVYRRPEEYEENVITLGAYLCMFPQLIAGPIVLFHDVSKQMKSRKVDFTGMENGLKLFTVGLGYKMLLANVLGNLWHEIQVTGVDSISSSMAWLGAIAFSLQLYFDFNGYSLMAIGLGEMLGFRLPRNFHHPYTAYSVTDFWRKWHITLSTWFREYLYIPLGGNRKGIVRTILNLFIVWSLTGIWHGAGWNFLLWGIYYFILLSVEKLFLQNFFEIHKAIGRCYTLLAVVSGWVIFALEDIKSITTYFNKMFCWIGQWDSWKQNSQITWNALERYGVFFVVGIFLCTYLPENIYKKHKSRTWFLMLLFVVFWASVYQMVTAVNNPFLYFRF
ncbi:MAG: MBOAT family O-acyltransferase [Lachnospiraceae bacterium]